MDSSVDVCAVVKPGAGLDAITNTAVTEIKEMNMNDAVVIWGGTNDISRNNSKAGLKKLNLFAEANSNTNIVIMSVPQRYDLQESSVVKQEVLNFNRNLKKMMKRYDNVKIVDVEVGREGFTKHGLHLNGRGKEEICKKIAVTIKESIYPKSKPSIALKWTQEKAVNKSKDKADNEDTRLACDEVMKLRSSKLVRSQCTLNL